MTITKLTSLMSENFDDEDMNHELQDFLVEHVKRLVEHAPALVPEWGRTAWRLMGLTQAVTRDKSTYHGGNFSPDRTAQNAAMLDENGELLPHVKAARQSNMDKARLTILAKQLAGRLLNCRPGDAIRTSGKTYTILTDDGNEVVMIASSRKGGEKIKLKFIKKTETIVRFE